jgi:hypothetical protein
MTEEVRTGRGRTLAIVAWIVVPILLLTALLVMTLRNPGTEGVIKVPPPEKHKAQESPLGAVRDTLSRKTDLATCRNMVTQLNTHLQRAGREHAVPVLPASKERELTKQLGLDDGDLKELTNGNFTALDAFHLESAFLFRDVARSLELAAPGGRGGKPVSLSPLERARLAFEWTVRQVRLVAPLDSAPVPPEFVLRRGSGTALERALVFLAVLEQLGVADDPSGALQGCLLLVTGKDSSTLLWACGVVPAAEPANMYLFDPRLGLPLPGPGGKGIATLAQARSDPTVLQQLKADKVNYDVTAEQARSATAALFVPLTALAPRMRLLQDHLLRDRAWQDQTLPAPVRVRLAEDDPGALARVQKAYQAAGGKGDVRYWPQGAKVLRGFVPSDEGGASVPIKFELRRLRGFVPQFDARVVQLPRRQLHQFAAVPWENFPAEFRDPAQFDANTGLGRQLRLRYAAPFLRDLADTGSSRDQMLRGHFREATRGWVPELEHWQQARDRRQAAEANLDKQQIAAGVQDWLNRAFAVFAQAARQGEMDQVNAARLWNWKPGEPIEVLVNGAIAELRVGEVTYQLALCRHEQAVRLQVRHHLAEKAGVGQKSDAEGVRKAWEQADYWWTQCLQDPRCPSPPDARRMHGEALLHLGKRAEAARVWRDLGDLTADLPKLARLRLAEQAGKSAEAN